MQWELVRVCVCVCVCSLLLSGSLLSSLLSCPHGEGCSSDRHTSGRLSCVTGERDRRERAVPRLWRKGKRGREREREVNGVVHVELRQMSRIDEARSNTGTRLAHPFSRIWIFGQTVCVCAEQQQYTSSIFGYEHVICSPKIVAQNIQRLHLQTFCCIIHILYAQIKSTLPLSLLHATSLLSPLIF